MSNSPRSRFLSKFVVEKRAGIFSGDTFEQVYGQTPKAQSTGNPFASLSQSPAFSPDRMTRGGTPLSRFNRLGRGLQQSGGLGAAVGSLMRGPHAKYQPPPQAFNKPPATPTSNPFLPRSPRPAPGAPGAPGVPGAAMRPYTAGDRLGGLGANAYAAQGASQMAGRAGNWISRVAPKVNAVAKPLGRWGAFGSKLLGPVGAALDLAGSGARAYERGTADGRPWYSAVPRGFHANATDDLERYNSTQTLGDWANNINAIGAAENAYNTPRVIGGLAKAYGPELSADQVRQHRDEQRIRSTFNRSNSSISDVTVDADGRATMSRPYPYKQHYGKTRAKDPDQGWFDRTFNGERYVSRFRGPDGRVLRNAQLPRWAQQAVNNPRAAPYIYPEMTPLERRWLVDNQWSLPPSRHAVPLDQVRRLMQERMGR